MPGSARLVRASPHHKFKEYLLKEYAIRLTNGVPETGWQSTAPAKQWLSTMLPDLQAVGLLWTQKSR